VSKDWDHFSTTVAGRAAEVFADLGLAEDAPLEKLTVAAWVQVAMLAAGEDGLATDAEVARLQAIEAALTAGLVSRFCAYVGRVSSGGRCDFIFYAASAKGWKEQVTQALQSIAALQFVCASRPDRDWDIYFERLSPSDEDLVRLQNRRICDSLAGSGDRLEQARPIEHWAYFPDAQARARFVQQAEALGLSVREQIEPEERGDQYGVRVAQTAVPARAAIDALTLPLYRAAIACHGEYEGWETEVIK
jgi:hypothetical protein